MNLSTVDVNLIVQLDALLRERSVTRAAKHVGLSQPAMSHALMRLREALHDPLLLRVGRKMSLTERAVALRPQVTAVMNDLERIFGAPVPFDPTSSARTFRVAASDYIQLLLVPELTAALAREAPRVALHLTSVEDAAEAVRDDKVDLALGSFPHGLPPDLHSAELFQDRFVGVVRVSHAAPRLRIPLEGYTALSHVRVTGRGPGDGVADALLDARGVARRVVIAVPHLLIAAQVVAGSDLCATVAELAAKSISAMFPIRQVDLPFELPPLNVVIAWSRRAEHDTGNAWLRRLVVAAAKSPRAIGRLRRAD